MSPARQHRERFAAMAAAPSEQIETAADSERDITPATALPELDALTSPARAHRLMHAAAAAADAAGEDSDGLPPPASSAESEMRLRLIHDLRRLKDIKAIDLKVAAKREMIPAYADWIDAQLKVMAETAKPVADEVLPTIAVWLIDIGSYGAALHLAEPIVRLGVAMPARYRRDAATLVTEEIADAALKAQVAGDGFDIEVLDAVDELIEGRDMHDQVRAKLMKAIGQELQRRADAAPEAPETPGDRLRALAALREATRLDSRIGVAGRMKALEKLTAAPPADLPPAT